MTELTLKTTIPYTEEERELDEFAKTIDFNDEDQVMEFLR